MKNALLALSVVVFSNGALACMPPPPHIQAAIDAERLILILKDETVLNRLGELRVPYIESITTTQNSTRIVRGANGVELEVGYVWKKIERIGECPEITGVKIVSEKLPEAAK